MGRGIINQNRRCVTKLNGALQRIIFLDVPEMRRSALGYLTSELEMEDQQPGRQRPRRSHHCQGLYPKSRE